MDRETTKRLRVTLLDTIDAWLEQAYEQGGMPYVGNLTASHMTDAALAVLLAIAEAQKVALADGYLKEDEGAGGAAEGGAMTYTITHTRRQILIKSDDGAHRRLFPRSDKGRTAAERFIGRLHATGYTERAPEPSAWEEIARLVREGRVA